MSTVIDENEVPKGGVVPPTPVPDPAVVADPVADGGDTPSTDRRARRRRRRRARRIVYVVLLILLSPAIYSYIQALRYPGSASMAVRSIEWMRDHGGGGLVDNIEVWYYTHNGPPKSGRPTGPLPPVPSRLQRGTIAEAISSGHLGALHPATKPSHRGEAVWLPGPTVGGGRPGIFTSWFRPDPKHPTLVAGVLSIDLTAAKLDLVAGTREPGGGPWPGTAQVDPALLSRTLAAFNSGFKMHDSHGAFYLDGRTAYRFKPGSASLVIYRDGSVNIGAWGREVAMSPNVHAVRQNLSLIVDGGKPVPGLVHNWDKLWGSRKSQLEYVWRSGVGIDAKGHIIYVAGNKFTLQTLADALVQAGAVRAMQMDIHNAMVSASLYRQTPGGVASSKLLPAMPRPATRYLQPDQRDFFTVVAR
ncbi:MAG: hypothetical protein JWN46_2622 [Acidimicrobiales bacterium]|nr:hypothetical protein [Acidimicrobiales bacterium]